MNDVTRADVEKETRAPPSNGRENDRTLAPRTNRDEGMCFAKQCITKDFFSHLLTTFVMCSGCFTPDSVDCWFVLSMQHNTAQAKYAYRDHTPL